MAEPPLLISLTHAFETSHGDSDGADERLGLALIWLIELYANELSVSYQRAAEQIALMCELIQVIESYGEHG